MRFTVPGEPKAKERPRMSATGHVYTPRATKEFEESVGWYAIAAGAKFGKQRVSVRTCFYFSKAKKPDGDNCHKAILDALQKAGVIENDRQVAEGFYSIAVDAFFPRTDIEIIEMDSNRGPICVYCGNPANSDYSPVAPTCVAHDDLLGLDPRYSG